MIELTKQITNYFFTNLSKPSINDLEIKDKSLLEKKGSLFVTLYINGKIRGSSGNIHPIKENIVSELIENIFEALNDKRFKKISIDEKKDLKIRIDEIISKGKPLTDFEINNIEPLNFGVFVIKTDYSKASVILPNISEKIITGSDFIPILSNKLGEEFEDKNFLVYKLKTKILESK